MDASWLAVSVSGIVNWKREFVLPSCISASRREWCPTNLGSLEENHDHR